MKRMFMWGGFAALMLAGCNPNVAILTLNAEPQGTSVYLDGYYIGSTPLRRAILVTAAQYEAGEIVTSEYTFAKTGYHPKKETLHLKVNSEDRWTEDKVYYFADLVLLEPNPNAAHVMPQPAAPNSQGDGGSFSVGFSVTKILVPRR